MTSPPAAPTHRRTSSTITSDIYTTCRALQTRLSTNLSQSPLCALRTPTLLPSPAFTTGAPTLRAKKKSTAEPAPKRPQTPPRGAKKRRRSSSDEESRDSAAQESRNGPSTPKRQRMAPPCIPLGLAPGDFERLERRPVTPSSPPRDATSIANSTMRQQSARPNLNIATISPTAYSSSLVALIREKLSLSEERWDTMESRTGDIDERWRALFADVEAVRGLRVRREMVIRRGGRRERMGLGALEGVW